MKKFLISTLAIAPSIAFAQDLEGLTNLLRSIARLVDAALPVIVGIALLGFFYGLAMFIFNAGDEEKRKKSRGIMIWGIVGLFVMVSVWGLVTWVGRSLDINQGDTSGAIPSVEGL